MAKDAVLPTSLPGEINAATRTLHSTLNCLITTRLPLALPPHTPTPSVYTAGLLHFAHIYLTLESLWTDLLPSPSDPPTSPLLSFLLVNPYDAPELFSSPPSPVMLRFLQHLRPRGLARSTRLKRDLEFLTGLHPTDLSVLLAQYPGEKVQEYCIHIRRMVKAKPHLLVAYAWCYYMAVFSGGRWIRSELLKCGEEFWRSAREQDAEKAEVEAEPERVGLLERGLSFWNFDGAHDGEDIKAEFKRRLAGAEDFFTPDERVDIIEEAKNIFKYSASLVQELDEKIGTDAAKLAQVGHVDSGTLRANDKMKVAEKVINPNMSQSAVTWLRRPEITGVFVALGCLACVALLRLDPRSAS
ncbi:heme oxygenase-like protein [Lindgomyces ingoldianus]|uniref:Heme oxygenase-like protein n=1 Tax=Lindgomyces ingoldianus TaxID=673940 RepID=A0ACB6R714_9PLEO|nr:heme oxygenase-like protein [Lindgomyces ingoldianus]KAF2475098.1 heme oxygenase-like protein [Lindgomyces ingoldianus]